MNSRAHKSAGWPQKLMIKSLRLRKWFLWQTRNVTPKVLLIVGCQRSGTSLLNRILEQDLRTTVLSEDNCLTGTGESRLRLKPYADVNRLLATFRTPLVVVKPLVESQNTPDMLKQIPGSKALWMFRDYPDVVNSDVNRFSSQIKNLKSLVEMESGNWRSERVSDHTRSRVSKHFADDMSPHDAAALMWYARNVLFFENGLDSHPDVLLCRYEDLVADAQAAMSSIYSFVGMDYPNRDIVKEVHANSFGLGRLLELDGDIEVLCDELQCRLRTAYQSQSSSSNRSAMKAISK